MVWHWAGEAFKPCKPSPQWSMVVASSCCGGASLPVAQAILPSSGGPWMQRCIRRSSRIISFNQHGSFVCARASCSSRATTPNTLPKSSRHGLRITTLTCWSGPASPQTSTPLRICGLNSKDGCMHEAPGPWMIWRPVAWRKWDNIPAETCANAIVNYRKRLVEVIAPLFTVGKIWNLTSKRPQN